jgi:hypothetical protein
MASGLPASANGAIWFLKPHLGNLLCLVIVLNLRCVLCNDTLACHCGTIKNHPPFDCAGLCGEIIIIPPNGPDDSEGCAGGAAVV